MIEFFVGVGLALFAGFLIGEALDDLAIKLGLRGPRSS